MIIKDALTTVILVVALVLGISTVVQTVRLNYAKGDVARAQLRTEECRAANVANQAVIEDLNAKNNALVNKIAADVAAAKDAVEQYSKLEEELAVANLLNERYRDELAAKDPEVAGWMDTGVELAVACSLWSSAAFCKN